MGRAGSAGGGCPAESSWIHTAKRQTKTTTHRQTDKETRMGSLADVRVATIKKLCDFGCCLSLGM